MTRHIIGTPVFILGFEIWKRIKNFEGDIWTNCVQHKQLDVWATYKFRRETGISGEGEIASLALKKSLRHTVCAPNILQSEVSEGTHYWIASHDYQLFLSYNVTAFSGNNLYVKCFGVPLTFMYSVLWHPVSVRHCMISQIRNNMNLQGICMYVY